MGGGARIAVLILCAALVGCVSGSERGQLAPPWVSDRGDGSYVNPPLYADYPDPDIIRVGDDFYFATTTFANTPGLTILHSRDLVNWEFASHVVARLDGGSQYDLIDGTAYRNGVYAPSLRHHSGVFYVTVTLNRQRTRIYRARNIEGPWSFVELDRAAFDPGLFFDVDGAAYIVTSIGSDGAITLLTLDADLTRIVHSQQIHFHQGAEGSKLIRRGDYYYLFNAIPRRLGLVVSRARSLQGPWETRDQIDDTTGGHQGALVDLPDGSDFGFVMLDAGAIGRVTNISPIFWEDGWPVWGTRDAPGRVPAIASKPIQGGDIHQPAASDEFDEPELGLQWQWNHNPDDERWSLDERQGHLRLHATQGVNIWTARNTLTQKGQGPRSRGEVRLDARHLRAGDTCGLGVLGKFSATLAVNGVEGGEQFLSMTVLEDRGGDLVTDHRILGPQIGGEGVYLAADLDFVSGRGVLSYSVDRVSWASVGGFFPLMYDWRTGTFQGPQFALFCFGPNATGGYVDVDWFQVSAPLTEENARIERSQYRAP